MKINVQNLAKQVVTEAVNSDEQVNTLVDNAIHEALMAISIETLATNFEKAKEIYYNNLRNYLSTQLKVKPSVVGKFLTSDMHQKFADALQKAYQALQPTQDKVDQEFSDPKFLLES